MKCGSITSPPDTNTRRNDNMKCSFLAPASSTIISSNGGVRLGVIELLVLVRYLVVDDPLVVVEYLLIL